MTEQHKIELSTGEHEAIRRHSQAKYFRLLPVPGGREVHSHLFFFLKEYISRSTG